jgi:hypothetical protein
MISIAELHSARTRARMSFSIAGGTACIRNGLARMISAPGPAVTIDPVAVIFSHSTCAAERRFAWDPLPE